MEMVPLEFEEGTNEYDCDTITQLENHPDPNLEDIVEEINEIPMEDTRSPLKSTNSNIPPTPRIKKLKAKEKSRLNRDIALVQMLQEEHNLKVKNMREAHEWAEEEHKLKVKKLKLENMLLEVQLNSTI
ncbi:uncharacterized protein LOC114365010 [Ostrinia furnacalis]|uniref:uncharacterized protein LOC114365010 n=1 Tax=Ostrinia furnacalis TaxID=93504 RepID=UPI001038C2AC|nr:uncharacterized protein LOC114365010 [Ostrinia furnacalis]